MTRTPVNSSTIESIGYDPATQTLEVDFKGSGIYEYFGISPELHKDLMESSSKGTFLHFNVIRKKFEFKKI